MAPRITWEDQALPGDFNNGEEEKWVALLSLKGNQLYGENSNYRIVMLDTSYSPVSRSELFLQLGNTTQAFHIPQCTT